MVVKMGVGGIGWGVVEDEARDVVVIFKVFSYFLVDRELDLGTRAISGSGPACK